MLGGFGKKCGMMECVCMVLHRACVLHSRRGNRGSRTPPLSRLSCVCLLLSVFHELLDALCQQQGTGEWTIECCRTQAIGTETRRRATECGRYHHGQCFIIFGHHHSRQQGVLSFLLVPLEPTTHRVVAVKMNKRTCKIRTEK